MRMRRIPAAVLALALTAGLAACGDDDDRDAASGGNGGTPAVSAASTKTFCDAVVALDAVPLPGGPGQLPTAEEIKAAFTPMVAALETIEKSAPKSLSLDVALMLQTTRKAATDGSLPEIDSPNYLGAQSNLHGVVGTECGFQNLEVKALDYAFQGIPSELDAGTSYLSFANGGAEFHELVVLRKKADTTESFEELIAQGDSAFAKVDLVGVTFAAPGQSTGITAELTAGDYMAICFIPVEAEGENGSPHFLHGMKTEFTVS